MSREWSDKRKADASKRFQEKNDVESASRTRDRIRIPVGARRDVTAVHGCPDEYRDRWVNDRPGRIDSFKKAGYENVNSASVGDPGIDGTHNEDGVVSRNMGQGVTAYLMRQRMDYFLEDRAEKQRLVDETEKSIQRGKSERLSDELNGEVRIGRQSIN